MLCLEALEVVNRLDNLEASLFESSGSFVFDIVKLNGKDILTTTASFYFRLNFAYVVNI